MQLPPKYASHLIEEFSPCFRDEQALDHPLDGISPFVPQTLSRETLERINQRVYWPMKQYLGELAAPPVEEDVELMIIQILLTGCWSMAPL